MKKTTFLAFAFLLASWAPVFAQDKPGGISFSGTAVDSHPGGGTINIDAMGDMKRPWIKIQVVEGTAETCAVDQPGNVSPFYSDAQNGGPSDVTGSGIVVLTSNYCYITQNGKNTTTTTDYVRLTFNWHCDVKTGVKMLEASRAVIHLQNADSVDGFSGTGAVDN